MPLNILFPALLSLSLFGSGVWAGYEFAVGQHAKKEQLVQDFKNAVAESTAKQISKIKVTNTITHQEVRREIVEKPVYSGCRHTPDGLRLVNRALLGSSSDHILPGINGSE